MKMHTRKQNMTVEPRRSQFNESQPFVILISHPSGSLMRILCRYDEGNACGCLSWTIARQCVRKDLTFYVCILSITWTYLPYYFHIDSFLTSWPFYILYCIVIGVLTKLLIILLLLWWRELLFYLWVLLLTIEKMVMMWHIVIDIIISTPHRPSHLACAWERR